MSAPPSGTVSFLFSDIEGSTRLLKTLRDGYAQVLAEHRLLIRTAVERHGGFEVDTQGDAFFIAFGQARQAVLGAVDIQRALADHPWPAGAPVRVRIGIHTGQASWSGEGYTGLAVHRAARIGSAARGGQVLISQATQTILADEEDESEFTFADLGEHQLKDLDRPVRLYEIVAPGLQASGRPPVPPPAAGGLHGFPAPLTSYVGRAEVVSDVAARLGRHRLVTVTGPGGAGKTRLSGQVARMVSGRYADGVWLAELAQVPDPALVAPAVAKALGVRDQAGIPAAEALAAVLARQQLLLVLDNCEQVITAVAELCARLLPACDDLRILATSREPLRIAGEARYRLAPLVLPSGDDADDVAGSEAVALFADRARQADPDFVLNTETGPAVARLVRRLDGMPLAIELAAARVEALGGVSQLLDQLDDRFALLDGGDRLAAGRHQSLAATVDWSYQLLDQAGQHVFRALSAFPGPFTLAAAVAVAGDDAGPGVLRLVDCSLLVPPRAGPDGQARYMMLETLRGYGAAQLAETGEQDQALAALARHAAHIVREAAAALEDSEAELTATRTLDAEDATVMHAMRWARSHDPELALAMATDLAYWWMLRGRLNSQYQLLDGLAGRVASGSEQWCAAHYWLGQSALFSADLGRALDHHTMVIQAMADREPSRMLADSLASRSSVLANQNRIVEAVIDGQRALALSHELAYPAGEAIALVGLSIAADYIGDQQEALRLARQAADIGDVPGSVARLCLSVLVNMLVETGGAAETEAEAICARAMTWCRSVDDLGSLAVLLVRRSILDLDTGQPDQAARHLRDAVRISGQSGNRVELANALGCGGDLAAATGRFRQAITLWAAFGALAIGELFPDLPAESRRRAEAVARARQALDPELTQAAEERGRAMNFATAVEFLLMVTDPAPGHARDGKLSTAERELVALVGQGRTDAQIAAELNMSADAVGADLGRIRDKTGAIRRSDLTRLALGTGMA